MSGRQNRDPAGKRALFSDSESQSDITADEVDSGRRSLYSTPESSGPTVTIECSKCGAAVPTELTAVVGQVFRVGAWWLPVKAHSRYLRCSACNRRAWCRVRWMSAFG